MTMQRIGILRSPKEVCSNPASRQIRWQREVADRATEQFKRLQDAYDYSQADVGRSLRRARLTKVGSSPHFLAEAKLQDGCRANVAYSASDPLYDERRNALIVMAAGAVGAVLLRRIVWIAANSGTLVIWGIVSSFISTHQNISTINEHLKEIELQKRSIEENGKKNNHETKEQQKQ